MDKGEPALVPQWYRAAGVNSSSSSNHHHSSSSIAGDQGFSPLSRNRLSTSTSERDFPRSSFLADRTSTSSFRRSRSSNGSMGIERDSSLSLRTYSSFRQGYRDKGREQNSDYRERRSSVLLDDEYSDLSDIFKSRRTEKDTLLRARGRVAGSRPDLQPKRSTSSLSDGVVSPKNVASLPKSSFDRDFPFLGAEDKEGHRFFEMPKVSSCIGFSLPAKGNSSLINGGERVTSVLAQVPAVTSGSQPNHFSVHSSTQSNLLSTIPNTNGRLNMAEALAKAPLRTNASPQLKVNTQRLEELAIKQSRQLIPVTPTTPKSSVLSASERLKNKGMRTNGVGVLAKATLQSSSLQANFLGRATATHDVPKAHQSGNLQVLNRDKNQGSINSSKLVSPVSVAPVSVIPNTKGKTDCRSTTLSMNQGSVVEKRLSRNRSSFFNDIRNGPSSNNATASQAVISPSTSNKLDEQKAVSGVSLVLEMDPSSSDPDCSNALANSGNSVTGTSNGEEMEPSLSDPNCSNALANCDNGGNENLNSFEEHGKLSTGGGKDYTFPDAVVDPDEEEARFLESLGWQGNLSEEALTSEEIDAFVKKYNGKLKGILSA